MNRLLTLLLFLGMSGYAQEKEYLIKLSSPEMANHFKEANGGKLSKVSDDSRWFLWTTETEASDLMLDSDGVQRLEPNRPIHLYPIPDIEGNQDLLRSIYKQAELISDERLMAKPDPGAQTKPNLIGQDPLFAKCWGVLEIGVRAFWEQKHYGDDIVVAVTDSGVDYTHEDLSANIWRNTREIPNNGIDDDGNGYKDDVIGWDFVNNDNRPYDVYGSLLGILLGGKNPGHGTHVSGVIAATANNRLGIAGVAPRVKIMPLRFLSERGSGDTAAAIRAIDYAVRNGAKIINASWGSEGEEKGDTALKEAIQRARDKGVLFVAAAGNGRMGAGGKPKGYDNDTDKKPAYPATYPIENIISVAALDSQNQLGVFSNYGRRTVHIAAPGVKILSTVPRNRYQDTIVKIPALIDIHWDGTSMAAPHVSGALALLWSKHRNYTAKQIKTLLLDGAEKIPSLKNRVVTQGKLSLKSIR